MGVKQKRQRHGHLAQVISTMLIVLAIFIAGWAVVLVSTENLRTSLLPIECGKDVKLPGCLNPGLRRTFVEKDGTISVDPDTFDPGTSQEGEKTTYNTVTGSVYTKFVPQLIQWFIGLIAALCVIIVMYGGLQWITSAGESSEKANKTIVYGILGFFLALLSLAIVGILNNLPTLLSSDLVPTAYAVVTSDNAELKPDAPDFLHKMLDKVIPNSPISGETKDDYIKEGAGVSLEATLIPYVIDIFLRLSGTIAFIFGVYGAYLIITAGTNQDNFSKGIKVIMYTLIGMLIISLAYVFVWNITQINFGS